MGWTIDIYSDAELRNLSQQKYLKTKAELKKAGAGERAHDLKLSEDMARAGVSAELAFGMQFGNGAIDQWMLSSGENYGKDFLAEWTLLDKATEVKFTKYWGSSSGILFMRCKSGDARKGQSLPLSYWQRVLPDSYFVLLHRKGNGHMFEFVGWVTRDVFLANWSKSAALLQKLNGWKPGYPAICLLWKDLNSSWEELMTRRVVYS